MSATASVLTEAAIQVTAGKDLRVNGPAHFHQIKVGGQNAQAAPQTDRLGNRLIFHAHASADTPLGKESKSSSSEAALAIPFQVTGAATPGMADIKLYCGWLGMANKTKTELLGGGSYGHWRLSIDAGLKLSASSDFTKPLVKSRLYGKAGGGWDVEASINDAKVVFTDASAIAAGEIPFLLPVHQLVSGLTTALDALKPDLQARWFGVVTFPNVNLSPNMELEVYLKAKAEAEAKAAGVLAAAFSYVDFNPGLVHKDIDDAKVRANYGVYLDALEINWKQPGLMTFNSNGNLIQGWYWLRNAGARADWVFNVNAARVKTQLWATLKPMVVTTFNGSPTYTEIGTSAAGNLRVENGKPVRFAVPKNLVRADGTLQLSVTWLGKDVNGDKTPEHVAVNAQALVLDYD